MNFYAYYDKKTECTGLNIFVFNFYLIHDLAMQHKVIHANFFFSNFKLICIAENYII